MPRFTASTNDFKTWILTLEGKTVQVWRDGDWHITNGGDTRLGTKSLHWSGAIRRAVEWILGAST